MTTDMHPTLLALQEDAWNLKDACDDLAPRKLSVADVATLDSVRRDHARLLGKVVGILNKRKRTGNGADNDDETPNDGAAAPEESGNANLSS